MKQTNKNLKAPEWDLKSIYPSLKSKEYKDALRDYEKGMDEIDLLFNSANTISEKSKDNFDFPMWLSMYISCADKTGALEESLAAYAYIIYSVNTVNKEYLDNLSRMEELQLRSKKQELIFRSVLKKNMRRLPEFYRRYPEFSDYEFFINEELDELSHQMSDDEENLASDLQRTGGDAWARLHEQLISNLKDKETGKTFNELRSDAYSPEAKTRKDSYKKELFLLEQNRIAFAAALNNLKGETVCLNKRRSWKNAVDRSLYSARMSKKTLSSLIGVIEESLPMWRRYMRFKAEILYNSGAASAGKQKGLSFFDMFAPIPVPSGCSAVDSVFDRLWTFEDARTYIIKEFNSFSKDMGGFAEKAFENNWIDASVRSGKVGGAYCQDFPAQKESRVLSNFTGSFSDVITLVHELGHAYHHSCITENPYLLSSYPMTLAETASTFAETIVKQDVASSAKGADKIRLLEFDLQDSCQILVDILSRYYFEQSVFEKRASEELTADDFCALMRDAQERSYGEGLNENRHEYMWAVKTHYYSTSLDFYNFPYAFGQLFALGLYARYKKEGPDFAKTYRLLLSDTGKMSCEDLCKKAGFDITEKDFWRSGISIYEKEFKELENLFVSKKQQL
ncbi:M3 family oligoendopeptidase [Treponema parvum]|uniref:M3 family oligoendopeptidase n=1 Tax=Treponema parvum TaxID=138851 RepID=A0A975F2C3_9SPIR|nr:M3 family oligoendopeptidase [Treponema parvum]QTQ13088.1 M3 family oligoendopeptidase [Treponema parvum]